MANDKATITLAVGVLTILTSIFLFILTSLTANFCKLGESCNYVPSETFGIAIVSFGGVGALLLLIGIIFGGGKGNDVPEAEREQ